LWLPVVLGFQQRPIAKWMALPLFVFWLAIMTLIWLYLLGVANIVSGHFFPTEIAMTIVVGAACVVGLARTARWRTPVRSVAAALVVLAFAAVQIAAFRISLIPYIARR
jgi:hypothetical protein